MTARRSVTIAAVIALAAGLGVLPGAPNPFLRLGSRTGSRWWTT